MTQPAEIQPTPMAAPMPPPAPPQASAGPDLVGVSALAALQDPSSATSLYSAGKLGFHADERVPVKLAGGEYGTVPGGELDQAIDGGAKIVHPDEVHRAEQEAKFGGAAGTAGAGVAGFGRGLTVGLSDPLTLAGAYAFGGQKSEDAMRERLNAYRELHPVASTVGEVAGIAAPAFFSGGTAAGVEGAGLAARGAEAGRGILAAAAAPMEGLSLAGRGAQALATRVVGEGAEGLAKRIAQKVIAKGAAGAAEGALFGAGQEVSEASLGNHELTGEKLWSSMGHGAIMGGLAAGALAGVGEAASPLLDKIKAKASPYLRAQGEEAATRALSATGRYQKAIDQLPGGRRAMGRFLQDTVGLEATDTVETLAPKTEAVKEAIGQKIGATLQEADALGYEGPHVEALAKRMHDSIVPDLEKMGLSNKSAIGAVDDLVADFKRFGGVKDVEELAPGRMPKEPARPAVDRQPPEFKPPRAPKEIPEPSAKEVATIERELGERTRDEFVRPDDRPALAKAIAAERRESAAAAQRAEYETKLAASKAEHDAAVADWKTSKATAMDWRAGEFAQRLTEHEGKVADAVAARKAAIAENSGATISLGKLHEFRAYLQDQINWNTNPLATFNPKVDAFKKARSILEDSLVEHGEKAAQAQGREFAEPYKALKRDYQFAKAANNAAQDAATRVGANARHSLTDKLFAGHGAMVGALAHGIPGALLGIAAGQASKLVREHGNAAMAVTFDKLASLQAIAKRSDAVDAQLARGVRGFMKRAEGVEAGAAAKPAGKSVRIGTISRGKDAREEYAQQVAAVKGAAVADHGPISADLAKHAPMTAAVAAQRAAGASAWLATQVPVPPKWGTQTATLQEMQDFSAKYVAVNDPAGTLAHGLQHGGLTKTQVDAIKATSPGIFTQVQKALDASIQRAIVNGAVVPYAAQRDMALLFDVNSTWSMTPEGVKSLQANAQEIAGGASQDANDNGSGMPPKPPQRKADATSRVNETATPTERRSFGGQIR